MHDLHSALRVWMNETLEAREWSAEHWAKLAGTSPTNITRFRSGVSDHVPSLRTVAKLAAAAGTWPSLDARTMGLRPTEVAVPVVSQDEIIKAIAGGEGGTQLLGSLYTQASVSSVARAFRLEVDPGWRAIQKGDMIVVEPLFFRPVKKLAPIVAEVRGSVVVGRYMPPYLIGEDPICSLDEAVLHGHVVEVRRTF